MNNQAARKNIERARKLAPELPWNCWEPDRLGPTLMKFMEDQEPFFARWAEVWYQNFQFIYGNQSLRWSRRYGYAVDSDNLRSAPAVNMRAQTNLSRAIAESLAAAIYSNLPDWAVESADESSIRGKRFKRIIQKSLDAYMVRLCMDKEFASAAMSYTVFGQFAFFTDWDANGGQMMTIPKWEKVQAPIFTDFMATNPFTGGLLEQPTQAIDGMGQPLFEERWEPLLDAQGRQIMDRMFAGDVGVTSLTPFEYRRELGSVAHRSKYWERIRLLDFDEFLDQYGHLPGRTKWWDQIQPVYSNPAVYKIAVRHFMRMVMTTPPSLGDVYQRSQTVFRQSNFKNKVLIVDHYDKPHPIKWPLGRRVVCVNGQAAIITEPNYHTNKIDGWHPFNEAQWFNIAPSSIAAGPMNDVIQKNRELNVADSLNATALRRNMGSQLLIKTGAGIDPQRLTGEPGMIHEVSDPLGFRWLHDDMPISPVVAQLRQQNKDDVYETSGAGDAIRGEKTPGVSSGYQQRQIREQEDRRISPAKKNFANTIAGCGEKIWSCLKANVTTLDKDVMGYLQRSAAGEYQPDDVVALLSTQTDFGVDIKVEADSISARSKATDQATLLELLNGPGAARAENPRVLDSVFKFFGVDHLRDASAPQRDRAQRENEVFSDMMRLGQNLEGVVQPVVLFEDDDDIHIEEHTEFEIQNADEIMRNPEFFAEFLLHLERHRLQKQEKEGEALPGTSIQTPNMAAQLSGQTPPDLAAIAQNTQMKQQQQAQEAKSSGVPKQPKAPTGPAPSGQPGARPTDPTAPSQNTPSGRQTA